MLKNKDVKLRSLDGSLEFSSLLNWFSLATEPTGGYTVLYYAAESVMHGQCDARTTQQQSITSV